MRTATAVDPMISMLRRQISRYGAEAPIFGEGLDPEAELENFGALVRFTHLPSAPERAHMMTLGVKILGQVGDIYLVNVPFESVDALVRDLDVVRIEATWSAFVLAPLDVTMAQIGVPAVRRHPDLGFDGQGVIVADIDSGIDPTHPHFFRADGGIFDWLDINENGVFDAGTDGVDLNGDLELDRNERLRTLDGAAVHAGQTENADGEFQAHVDWLFADSNGDRARNVGQDSGFAEGDMAFGEPIFVIDDVDGDDTLDVGEHLLRLGSSKIRAIIDGDQVYTRGQNLLASTQAENYPYAFHGTGVSSILLGGQEPHTRRGVAPGADLLMYAAADADLLMQNFSTSEQMLAIQDAQTRGASIVLHEWTDPFRAALDGSTLFDEVLSSSREQGIFHVTPVGNLNLSGKHRETVVSAGTARMTVDVPAATDAMAFDTFFGSLMWREHAATLVLRSPSGALVTLDDANTNEIEPGIYCELTKETTARGYTHAQFLVWNDAGPLDGQWTFEITGLPEAAAVVGRVTDYQTGWSAGVGWKSPTQDHGTIVFPSTSDASFGVAAFGGRWPLFGSQPGEMRPYSGRGPRIDGAQAVKISAPDDPYAALSATSEFLDAGYERHWLTTFGGTSGAAPHAAGAAALLVQSGVTAPDKIASALTLTARNTGLDATFGDVFPNDTTGFGRLDVARVFAVDADPDNLPPSLSGTAVVDLSAVIDVSATDPENDVLMFRYDVDYDGTFDTDWTAESAWSGPAGAAKYAKVSVRDVVGNVRSMLIPWQIATSLDPEVEPPRAATDDCDGCESAPAPALYVLFVALIWARRRVVRSDP